MRRRNPNVKIVNGYEIKHLADLKDADFKGADLEGADLRGADLERANLHNANLRDADLRNADLREAILFLSDLRGAKLNRADLTKANLSEANLEGADLKDAILYDVNLNEANLAGAHLENADLKESKFHYANLKGAHLDYAKLGRAELLNANLEGAFLDRAKLDNAKLHQAILSKAQLTEASLHRAVLEHADLQEANLEYADLTNANLEVANLSDAHLEHAHLIHASLFSAILHRAHLEHAVMHDAMLLYARLQNANLENAILVNAKFNQANLEGTNFTGANLNRAVLRGAQIDDRTNFTNADLSYACLENTDLSAAILTGTILENVIFDHKTKFPANFDMKRVQAAGLGRSYGEMTGSVLKLGKPDSPPRAADFKQKHPVEFERLIKDTGGKDFTDSVKENIRNKYRTPFNWVVTRQKYKSEMQRLSIYPNDVILLNIDLEKIDASKKQIEMLKKLSDVSRRSNHPHARHPLFTIGWVRFDVDEAHKVYLVEEVQSDVQVVRQQTKNMDAKTRDQLEDAGIEPEDFDAAFEAIRLYADRFYEDALGILFMEAEEKGYSVEMLGYGDKKEYGSPRSIYTDLPRKMGMRPQPTQTDLELKDKVSYYKPNPSRPRRRY